ncbi:uncharacterized protein LOC126902493 isoform X2 [Daktulosphaira vitifoliae]|nr:uncharacterized protein LOC126902493 isoform X2 [Daktulosphaira vitifoliae]
MEFSSPRLSIKQIENISNESTILESSLKVYSNRIQELKCNYGIIVQVMFEYVSKLIEVQTSVDNQNMSVISKFKYYITKMFSLLYVAKINASSWIWDFYLMLNAIKRKTFTNFAEKFNMTRGLRKSIDKFSMSCNDLNIVKPNLSIFSLYYPVEKIIGASLFNVKLLNGSDEWTYVYKHAKQFDISNIIVIKLQQDPKINNPQSGVSRYIKKELGSVWNTPVSDWYGNKNIDIFKHQNLIANIIRTSISLYVWMHLKMYHSLSSSNNEQFLNEICKPLESTDYFLGNYTTKLYRRLLNDIKMNRVTSEYTEKIIAEAKCNFTNYYYSLNYSTKFDDVEYLEITSLKKFENLQGAEYANRLKNYIVDLKEKLGTFIFALFHFVKSSRNDNWSNF